MNAEQIAGKLGGAKKHGAGWMCLCPAHDDKNPSLGLKDNDDGTVTWNCLAGCDPKAVGAELKAKGLLPEPKRNGTPRPRLKHRTKLNGGAAPEPKAKREWGRIVATYDYVTADGELICQTVRFEPKDFKQRRPDPDKPGGWIWKLDGIENRPLYRLPELLAADLAATVYLVEGEKDCDRLHKRGLIATTTAQGAKSWGKSDHAPLTGRHVVIVPDNDPAGVSYVDTAARDLASKAASLRVLRLSGLDLKGDVSDWLDDGHNVKELAELAAATPVYELSEEDTEREHVEATIRDLAKLSTVDYERKRKQTAKELNFRPSALDKEVEAARGDTEDEPSVGQGRSLSWPEIEPWPDPVDGAELLNKIAAIFARYLMLPHNAAPALALWALHTHCFEASPMTPRLAIISPTPRCGKTTTMEILERLVFRPILVSSITAAAVFRTVELARPTLLIDEFETFLKNSEELRGILNSGNRRTGTVIRTVGDSFEPRQFSTWCPVVLAGADKLPETLADRSIKIGLTRKTSDEKVERWRSDRPAGFDDTCSRCARWADDFTEILAGADPEVPESLHDRAADNWRPLLAIADAAGGDWPAKARATAEALSGGNDAQTLSELLLADLKAIFDRWPEHPFLTTEYILARLVAKDERPWKEYGKAAKPLNDQGLRSLLDMFKVYSTRDICPFRNKRLRGYDRAVFEDSWKRFLTGPTDDESPKNSLDGSLHHSDPAIRPRTSNGAGSEPIHIRPHAGSVAGSTSAKNPAPDRVVDGWPDRNSGERPKSKKPRRNGTSPPPAWDDLDAWNLRLKNASQYRAVQKMVVHAWARAAGAADNDGNLVLPAGLPEGLALTSLKQLMREYEV